VLDEHTALAHVRSSKSPKPGTRLIFAERWEAEMLGREGELFKLRFLAEDNLFDILDASGKLPLPPYRENGRGRDDERYQTVYAREKGAVAAPTAGLHFTEDMLDILQAKGVELAYVTLHVGAGTFQPVRVDNIADHKMHSEIYDVPQRTYDLIQAAHARGSKVLAVAPPACARWNPLRAAARWWLAGVKPTSLSRRVIASAWWTACSPISTCPNRHC
jgi:S-adenosylmethionine:tRNA ribosyltransferase-isomerase